ncbi:MAG TPA: transglycosylase domain-containing protein [Anaeromyxobacteraceae bacterium]|nr:transglycosylase domain-containing protein [Anaeromyxobacteraceae bacterium]
MPGWARRTAAVTAGLTLLWAGALIVANREGPRSRLREAIRGAVSRRLPGAEIGDSVSVDPLFRVTFGPLAVRAERKGAPPVVSAERVKVRASFGALLRGRLVPASIRLYGVRIVPGERLGELRALAERMKGKPASKPTTAAEPAREEPRDEPRDWPAVHLRGATLVIRIDDVDQELGPVDASVRRRRSAGDDDLELTLTHRLGGRAWAELHRGKDGYRLRASLLGLVPEALPPRLASGAVRWSGGSLSSDVALAGEGLGAAKGRLRVRLDRASFAGERLAAEPVGPVTLDLDGAVEVDPAARRIALREGHLKALGALDAAITGEARVGPGLPFSFVLDAPGIDYGELAAALPAALRPPTEAPHPSGPFSFRLALSGPLREPALWAVDASLDLASLREAARRGPPFALRSTFTYRPEVETGAAPSIRVGPENPSFVPLAALPEHVVRAVTASEDAGFYGHSGFDFEELRNAFAQGREVGHVVRGASTITQQLAKNLYLSREKTLVRKAREAMVAIGLEAAVPKARLLEIYLNIAEWGPGLWGIGPAAQHYFGKPATDLSIREAAFLASIIPNPVRFHYYYSRGELDDAWNERLRVLLMHMTEAGTLSEEQFLEALSAPLHFASRTAALEEERSPGEDAVPDALEPAPLPGEELVAPGADPVADPAIAPTPP